MSATDYKYEQLEASSKTQRATILHVLNAAGHDWVPLPRILELRISQYGARIYELRRLGHRIENRSEWRNGKRHSWFRLSVAGQAGVLFPPVPEGWHRDDG